MQTKKTWLNFLFDYVPIVLVASVIIVSGVLTGQAVYKIIPAVVSLFTLLLKAKLYRIAFLVTAANCVLYSVGFYLDGLYGSLASTLLMTAPLSLVTYFMWKKKAYKQATIFKRFKAGHYFIVIAVTAAVGAGMYFISLQAGGANSMILLDSLLFSLNFPRL